MPHARLLVFDEDMPKRVATEVRNRGRRSTRVTELKLRGASDPELIAELARQHPDCVLVTGNYWMPAEHEEVVEASLIAIATIDPRVPDGYSQESWRSDVTHRWIHVMQTQEAGSVRRYALARAAKWSGRIHA